MRYSATTLPLIFLLLGFATSARSETCPDEKLIAPCTCEEDDDYDEIQVSCFGEELNLSKFQEALKALVGKRNVDLALGDFSLGTLPSNIFQGIGITKLDMSHCDLDSLSDGGPALVGLENTLEELQILGCFTEDNVPATLNNLAHLSALKNIDLAFNAITEIGNDWFEKGTPNLEYLSISNNAVEKLGDRAFEKLTNLKEFEFHGNRVGPLKRSMFPATAARLEKIELDNNALTSIPIDMFNNMPSLDTISLRNNGILQLEEHTWASVWQQLQTIYLEGNPIQCDSHLDWTANTEKTPYIYGRCDSPREVADKDIRDYIKSKRKQ